jgi:small-conductance mechanosensitive channel
MQDFGNEIVRSVNEFHNQRDKIRNKPAYQFDTPAYASDEVKRQLINEARQAEEAALKERTKEKVEATLNAYPDKVVARREELQQKIMEPLTNASADMLSRLAMSFEEDLADMLEAALAARNKALTGMLFAEAVRRDLPHIQQRIAAEVGGKYREFLSLPKDRDEALAKADQQRFLVNQRLAG